MSEVANIGEHALGVSYPGDSGIEICLIDSPCILVEGLSDNLQSDITGENNGIVILEGEPVGQIDFTFDSHHDIQVTATGTIIYHPINTYLPEVVTYLSNPNALSALFLGENNITNLFASVNHNHDADYAPISAIQTVTADLSAWFELVNPGSENEYLRCKKPLAGDYEIMAYADSGQLGSIWENIPTATPTSLGGIMVGTTLSIVGGVLNLAEGTGFDESKAYNPTGVWNFTIMPNVGGSPLVLASSYTAADVLAKLKTVDGVGSGINSDLLDGYEANAFSLSGHTHPYLPLTGGSLSGSLDITGDLHVTGNITADGEIAAFIEGIIGETMWDSMPLATATTRGGIKLNTAQFVFNASDQLTILDSVIAPKVHTHIWTDIISGVPDYSLNGHAHVIADVTGLQTALNAKLNTSLKGAVNGLAELDGSGKVLSAQLPSYVDDVLEYATSTEFPAIGESGKIYIAINTNLSYRWTGSGYAEVSPSIALGETSATAYRGDRGKIAYDHSQSSHAYLPLAGGVITGQIVLSVATGTSPFSIASTTVNTNLNADLLDGRHSSYFAPINAPQFTGGASITGDTVITGNLHVSGDITADGEVAAFIQGVVGSTIWENMPYATATTRGGIKVGTTLTITDGVLNIGPTITASLDGNASTATKLATARTIWGQGFDGSANISGAITGATTGAFSSTVTVGGDLLVNTPTYPQIRLNAGSGATTYWTIFNAANTENTCGSYTVRHHNGTYYKDYYILKPTLTANTTGKILTDDNLNSIYTPFQILTDATTITWNIANGYNATVTLAGNRTLSITGATNGISGVLIVKQNVTGGNTLTLPAGSKLLGGGTLTLSTVASAIDMLTFIYDGTNYYWSLGKNYA